MRQIDLTTYRHLRRAYVKGVRQARLDGDKERIAYWRERLCSIREKRYMFNGRA